MNNLNWQYVKPLQNPDAIAQLATETGVKLPDDIVSCLQQHNGGRPDKKSFDTKQSHERVIKSILSFNKDDKGSAYIVVDVLKKEKPGIFPFASDPSGNYICVSTTGEIVLWLHETNDVEAVAKNFSEFLASLYE